MQLVGARFRGQADLPYVAAVFRRVVHYLGLHFLHRVHVDVGDRAFNPVIVVVQTVNVITNAIFGTANVQLLGSISACG